MSCDSQKLKTLCDVVFVQRRNVFFHGSGGCGKSTMLKQLFQEAKRQRIASSLTSATGYAALQIGGQTLHRWAGIALGNGTAESLLEYVRRNKKSLRRWMVVKVLMIDEISMIGASLFEKLNYIGQKIKNNTEPFGGITVVTSGDFLQLKPIRDRFAFESEVWASLDFHIEHFVVPYRFSDAPYFELLQRARIGELTNDDVSVLRNRLTTFGAQASDIKPTVVQSLLNDVTGANEMELDKLEGVLYEFEADDDVKTSLKINKTLLLQKHKKTLDSLVQQTVKLKVGAQVMLTVNLYSDELTEDGPGFNLVNGSRGVVISIDEKETEVKVRFDGGCHTISMYPFEMDVSEDENRVVMVRLQLPLILAYSLTFHKIQGATLSSACLNLGSSVFASGMGYVGLSRVRCLDGLHLTSFDPRKIVPDKKALAFEKSLY